MQILNLANLDKSDIKYSISRFPDGEVQITLNEFSRKDNITVICRVTSAEDLFILCQINDILTRHGVEWNLKILYLMGMRMDRVMDFSRPFTLQIIANIIKQFSCNCISVLEAHSHRAYSMLGASEYSYLMPEELVVGSIACSEKYNLVLPDEGAYKRIGNFLSQHKITAVVCQKKRDVETGQLLGFQVMNPEVVLNATKPLLIVDDLCDGGGTFCGIAAEIRKIRPDIKINICVTHMVNPKGIENLSKNFDHVWFTNSYRDWNDFKAEYGKAIPTLPENVTQINII